VQYLPESEPASDAHDVFDEPKYPPGTSEVSESDTQPIPVDDTDDDSNRLQVAVCVVPESPIPARPEWWTDAWGKLEG
jgi:hypothetical protein